MKLKHITYCMFLLAFCVLQSCDVISDENRIVEMDEVIPQKKVLLLDFTDQMCINCAQAVPIIDSLQQNFGDAVIAVSIHSKKSLNSSNSLVTQEGKDYDEYYKINDIHPNGVIDGFGVFQCDLWGGEILKRFNIPNQANLELTTNYNLINKQIDIVSEIFNVSLSANLKYQLWIIEDSIVDWQLIGVGNYNMNYVHNHVFRSSVNGFRGENLITENGKTTLNHTFTVTNEKWNVQHLSAVGFIFNASTDEVYEVKQSHLFKN